MPVTTVSIQQNPPVSQSVPSLHVVVTRVFDGYRTIVFTSAQTLTYKYIYKIHTFSYWPNTFWNFEIMILNTCNALHAYNASYINMYLYVYVCIYAMVLMAIYMLILAYVYKHKCLFIFGHTMLSIKFCSFVGLRFLCFLAQRYVFTGHYLGIYINK